MPADADPAAVDLVFKALADPTRRLLLDHLREEDGQTLGQLCAHVEMTRQSTTQHLDVLEAANLISTSRRGREKVHHLNVVPLHEMQERWIDAFERPRLRALSTIKRRAEEAHAMSTQPAYTYVTYIESTPEKVWEALTDADITAQYWGGHRNESDWQVGSEWRHVRVDGSGIADVIGTVVESDPPRRLVTTWDDSNGGREPARATYTIEPHEGIVRLTVVHEDLPDENALRAISGGWPAVLANLKTFLETGSALSASPFQVPRSETSSVS